MGRIYLDTSAYLSVLLGEKNATEIKRAIKGNAICSSSILFLESERNLVRLSREKILKRKDYEESIAQIKKDLHQFILRDFTVDLCMTGSFPAVQTPRSLDLIHLRTAQWFSSNGGLKNFISLDTHQISAAKDLGLPVPSKA